MDVTKLNLFALCRCLRHAGKIMVLIVLALVVAIWYSTLVNAFIPGLRTGGALAALWALGMLAHTALVGLILWCYLVTFLTVPGYVPAGWAPFQDEEAAMQEIEEAEARLVQAGQQRSGGGGGPAPPDLGRAYLERPRFCKKCQAWKPPRAHHCSMTGRCVLKMDHYCVWVLNCVGLLNYKFFVLFLGYAFLGCLASAALLIHPCIRFFKFEEADVGRTILAFICFVFSAAFSLALLGFLIMHARLILTNHTTIEAYEKRPVWPWPYDHGRAANVAEVFGRPGWRRYAPLRSPEELQSLLALYLSGGGVAAPGWGGLAGAEQQMGSMHSGGGGNDV